MNSFDHILKWELKSGSHKFPGPAGGTCINEAAIIAAGFEYKAVKSWEDCPPCFCPVLAQFAIAVNDLATDQQRPRLMPLVTKLAGSNDEEAWVADERMEFLRRSIARDIVDRLGPHGRRFLSHNAPAEVGGRFEEAWGRSGEVPRGGYPSPPERAAVLGDAVGALMALLHRMGPWRYIEPAAVSVSAYSADMSPFEITNTSFIDHAAVWEAAFTALNRAFRIGAQAPALETAQIVERMETEKAKAMARA